MWVFLSGPVGSCVGGGASRWPWRRCCFWWLRRWAGPVLGLSGQLAVRWRLRMVRGVDVYGLRRSSSNLVSVLSASPLCGVPAAPTVFFGGSPLAAGCFALCASAATGWPGGCSAVADGGLCRSLLAGEVLELFAGRKLCLGGRPGPTTVTPVGAAYFLKASSKRVFSCSPLGFSGRNPRSLAGSGVGGALASFCLLGPRFGCPPDKGTCGVFWWFFGGGGFVFGQAGRGLGAGVVVGAVAPVFRLRLLR